MRWSLLFVLALGCSAGPDPDVADAGADAAPSDVVVAPDSPPLGDAGVGADAAPADPCTVDAGVLGASRCGCPGFSICDDFEKGLDPAWTVDEWHATHAIDPTVAARGSAALKIHVDSAGGRMLLTEKKTFPGQDFWARIFLLVSQPITQAHMGLFAASGPLGSGTTEVRLGTQYGELRANYSGPSSEYGIFNNAPPVKLGTGAWKCIEVHYAGPKNELHTYLDEQEVTGQAVLSTNVPVWTAPAYGTLSIGPILFHDDQATSPGGFDYWLDAVAVAPNRIGCHR